MLSLEIVLAAVRAGVALYPEGKALVEDIKQLFGETDQAAIDRALAESGAEADAQHGVAQGI